MSHGPYKMVDALQERIRAAEIAFHEAYWDSQIDASPANDVRREQLEIELRAIKGDPTVYQEVLGALDEDVHDPVLLRQLQLLKLSLTGNQMSDEQRAEIVSLSSSVESDFASYRPQRRGHALTDNDIEEVLKRSDDEGERRDVWEASKEIGAIVADRVRELARLRNAAARDLGFADFYRMSLELQEMSEEWLFSTLDQLETMTDDPYARWKDSLDTALRKRFGTAELYPWHYADPFFQSVPPDATPDLDGLLADKDPVDLTHKTFTGWGFDLHKVIGSSDLYPRANKCQHAFCLDIDRSGSDVRILCNIVPGERWTEVMLHESGHAAYDVSLGAELPYLLKRAAHTFVTEAIALMCGALSQDPKWLTSVAECDPARVDDITGELASARAAQSLIFARWGAVMAHFERELYSDPEADLDSIWWGLVERFQSVARPPGRSAPDWAAKIHVAVAPVYYHNYILGEVLAAQLRTTIERETGGLIGRPEAGALLRERVFASGALLRWDALVEAATGRELAADDYAAAITV